MLVLSRKIGERLLIGDQVVVTVVKSGPGGVRLGIQAPANMPVVREELAEQIAAEEEQRRQDAATIEIEVDVDAAESNPRG